MTPAQGVSPLGGGQGEPTITQRARHDHPRM